MSPSLNYFLPYQADWIKDDHRTAIGEKSRRIGFTYAESYRSVERRVLLGTNHYFASRDKESAGEFIDYCKMWAQVMNAVALDMGEQLVDEESGLLAFVLRFENVGPMKKSDCKIVALSSNPNVFRSKGGDVTLDEFAFHKDARKVLKAANASAKVWDHQLRIISTHNGEGSLFDLLCRSVREGKRSGGDWSLHTVTLADAVEQGLAEKIKKLDHADPVMRRQFLQEIHDDCIDESEWDEEYCCIPSSEESSLLSYDLL
jgi:phage FluMu gp28-like protein